ncbi:MAG: Histidinol-phosphatase [Calditrichaeota bacterium]|nr:Histidinol-phosphatase [Calditrichota bacterium]
MRLTDNECERITRAMLNAARATQLVQQAGVEQAAWKKQDRTPVTIADLASQAILLGEIAAIRPAERVHAEEEAESVIETERAEPVRDVVEQVLGAGVSLGELRERIRYRGAAGSGASWFVDPIDGTKGYVKGLFYAVAVGRVSDGAVTEACMAVPTGERRMEAITGRLFVAQRGRGVRRYVIADGREEEFHLDPAPSVTEGGRLAIIASRAHDTVELPPGVDETRWRAELLSMDSQAKYAALASGAAELYPRKPSRSFGAFLNWDHAAGVLLVEEAGGKVTDLLGEPLDWTRGDRLERNTGIFAARSPELHAAFQPLFAAHR